MSGGVTVELLEKLVDATGGAREAVREAHEARKDLRLVMKEADARLTTLRDEVRAAVDELAVAKTKEVFEALDFERITGGLKKSLGEWIEVLGEAKEVLDELELGVVVHGRTVAMARRAP